MPVTVKNATCGPRSTLKVTSLSMSCNNYGIIRLTNRKTHISRRSETPLGTQNMALVASTAPLKRLHCRCYAKTAESASSSSSPECNQCHCDSQAVAYIMLWVAGGNCAANVCNRIRGDRSRCERLMTLPYLTLPYLTLPYLTLPYLTSPYPTLPYLTLP